MQGKTVNLVVAVPCATATTATPQLTSEGFEAQNPAVSKMPVSYLWNPQRSISHF
jgi:hypothetical protein